MPSLDPLQSSISLLSFAPWMFKDEHCCSSLISSWGTPELPTGILVATAEIMVVMATGIPPMLLSQGQVSLQMSEELMAQWDSAPLGEKCEPQSGSECYCVSTSGSETDLLFIPLLLYFSSRLVSARENVSWTDSSCTVWIIIGWTCDAQTQVVTPCPVTES